MSGQKLGQHFLRSPGVLERIAKAACGEHAPFVVEIGPGRGALTEHLLRHADRVVAIELDRELSDHLKERWRDDERLVVFEGNALDMEWSRWGAGVLAGNLPYYVSTPIISKYTQSPGLLSSAVFLVQKEVAERITARPGTREYGYFSVECQLLAKVEILFSVPPGAFRPPPKVDSAVIRLTPIPNTFSIDRKSFLKFVSACFRQKRKMLRNNLLALYSPEQIESMPDLNRRAEQLSVKEFVGLFRNLAPQQK